MRDDIREIGLVLYDLNMKILVGRMDKANAELRRTTYDNYQL